MDLHKNVFEVLPDRSFQKYFFVDLLIEVRGSFQKQFVLGPPGQIFF